MKKEPDIRFEGFVDDWEQRKLGKVFKTYSGMTPLRSDISNFKNPEVPWIKTTDLKNSDITSNDEKISAKAANKLKVLPVNTVLIAMYGGFNQIGRTGLLTYPATINQALTALEPNDSISPYFLLTELNYRVNDWKKFAASSRKDPNITKRDIDNFMINFPTQQEQQKIGSFFQQLDNTITLHQQKLELLKKTKKGYLQKMFPKNGETVPEIRIEGFSGEWEQGQLKDILNISKEKNKSEKYSREQVLSVSREAGTVNQIEYQGRSFAGANISGYKVVKPNQMIYTKSPLKGAPYGIFQKVTVEGIVSPLYAVYDSTEKALASFISLQLKDDNLATHYLSPLVSKGAKNTINITDEGALMGKVYYPSKSEQSEIVDFFSKYDIALSQQQKQLELLKSLKKSLLQKMFI
ncbi:restriction endonuclease subunit S [Lactococcus petauri]|uniref:restriction endonuclease subunit S n=1 Tax=Lactococcus petauri TaxID=1940789 RepID=UPI001F58C315|nr:restriction endonuclease subunit S [Lactococcus petauri]